MTANEIVAELKSLGSESYKNTMLRHGVCEPLFGVKIGDMKKILKRTKKNYELALELYDTGIYDAMYLAGLMTDDAKMTKKDLTHWVKKAGSPALSEYTVPWVAAESNHGYEIGLEWIESKEESVASSGWATLSGVVALTDDEDLDLAQLKKLLDRVQKTIHKQPNRVRYSMNGFVIALGTYVRPLTELAIKAAEKIGEVTVDVGDTACTVPRAAEYLKKIQERGGIGKKRKTVKC